MHRELGRAKDLSALLFYYNEQIINAYHKILKILITVCNFLV